MSLIKKIKDYYKNEKITLFTTPSHAQGEFIPEDTKKLLGETFFKSDFSEIEGFDNLRNPSGILDELQLKIAGIYRSKYSFVLTNGSTSGIVALMLATLKENDKVLVARNCHVSIYNGLVLTGAKPVWLIPEYNTEWGIFEELCPQKIESTFENNPDIKALILTSPTYEGVYSNICDISKVAQKFGVKLIVDEAHGALTHFGDFKTKPAILCGADASVQSLHKTAGAPNPCAVLHLSKSTKISKKQIQNALNLINTTSPSYPLIGAVESTVNFLNSNRGRESVNALIESVAICKADNKNIEFYEGFNDPTRLLIKIPHTNSLDVSNILNKIYKIEEEFSSEKAMLFITGIGTTSSKLERLFEVLRKIRCPHSEKTQQNEIPKIPETVFTPRETYFKLKKSIELKEAAGKISAETIITYPPGIPILIPGERIQEIHLKLIKKNTIEIVD